MPVLVCGRRKKRIQLRQWFHPAERHMLGGLQRTAPATAEQAHFMQTRFAQPRAPAPGLIPAALIQISLGFAVFENEAFGIAETWRAGVTHDKNRPALAQCLPRRRVVSPKRLGSKRQQTDQQSAAPHVSQPRLAERSGCYRPHDQTDHGQQQDHT